MFKNSMDKFIGIYVYYTWFKRELITRTCQKTIQNEAQGNKKMESA